MILYESVITRVIILLVENNKIILFLFHKSLYLFCYIGRKETHWSFEPRCRAGRRGRPPLWYCSRRFIEVFLLKKGLAILYGLVLSFSNVALMSWLGNSPKGRKAKDPIYTSTKRVVHYVKLDNIYWLFNQSNLMSCQSFYKQDPRNLLQTNTLKTAKPYSSWPCPLDKKKVHQQVDWGKLVLSITPHTTKTIPPSAKWK